MKAVGEKRDMEDDRCDQGEWGTTEYNITEEGGYESHGQSRGKLEEDCGKKLIYKKARERDGDSKDVNTREG